MYDSSGKCIFRNVKPFTIVKAPSLQKFERHTHFDVEKGDYNLDKYYVAHKHTPNFNVSQKGNNVLNTIGLPEMYFKADTTYQNKYPKYTKDQEIIQRWQTEKGTENKFNTQMRAEALNESVEDIKQGDLNYQSGLDEVKKLIKSEYNNKQKEVIKPILQEEAEEHKKVIKQVPTKIKPVKIENVFDKEKIIGKIKEKVKEQKETAETKINKFVTNKTNAQKIRAEQKEIKEKYLEGKAVEKLREQKAAEKLREQKAKEMGEQRAKSKIGAFVITRSKAKELESEKGEETAEELKNPKNKSGRKPLENRTEKQLRKRLYDQMRYENKKTGLK